MKTLTSCFFFALVVLLFGCGGSHRTPLLLIPTEAQVMNVEIGMSKLDVIETIGSPTSQQMVNGELVYHYSSFNSRERILYSRTDYNSYKVVFDKNNRVDRILHYETKGLLGTDIVKRRIK